MVHACQLWIDGAARGNPGPASVGVVIRYQGVVVQTGYFLGHATNNYAEYAALLVALTMVRQLVSTAADGMPVIQIYSDSLLLVQQMTGRYRVKHHVLTQLHQQAKILLQDLTVEFSHVLREKNKEADFCANKALDNKTPLPCSLTYLFRAPNSTHFSHL